MANNDDDEKDHDDEEECSQVQDKSFDITVEMLLSCNFFFFYNLDWNSLQQGKIIPF
jgi:hypothetical protein